MIRSDVIVVGGGIAGLSAARKLRSAGLHPVILDKGRGPGGRLATLRVDTPAGEAVFDYGAQQISARGSAFQRQMADWVDSGVAAEWCHGFPAPGELAPNDATPRYRGTAGIRGLAADLAASLDLHLRTRVTALVRSGDGWTVETDDGRCFTGTALLLTTPVPQALDLLKVSGIAISASHIETLKRIVYEPCIAVLALAAEQSAIPDPGAMRLSGEPLIWVADNLIKGISPEVPAVTLHAGPLTSERLWCESDQDVAREMLAAARPWIGSVPELVTVHRWRYSRPVHTPKIPFAVLGTAPPLVLAGDGFSGSRVEGAWTSGRKAGGWMKMQLGGPSRSMTMRIGKAMTATGLEKNR